MQLNVGDQVEIKAIDYRGVTGKVVRVFQKSRGEPTVVALTLDGEKSPLSFLDHELRSLNTPERKRRSDAGKKRGAEDLA